MKKLIEEAKRIHAQAIEELERGEKLNNEILIRDAAEKAWLAAIIASDELIITKEFPIPETHGERYRALRAIEAEDEGIKKLGLSDRLGARDTHLHRQCFYKGECEADAIKEDLGKVKSYVEDIEKIVASIENPKF
jgi:hypothetical protein